MDDERRTRPGIQARLLVRRNEKVDHSELQVVRQRRLPRRRIRRPTRCAALSCGQTRGRSGLRSVRSLLEALPVAVPCRERKAQPQ